VKTGKSAGVAGGEGEYGDDVVGLLVRETEFGYFAVKKEQSCLQVKCQEKWSVAVRRICGVGVY